MTGSGRGQNPSRRSARPIEQEDHTQARGEEANLAECCDFCLSGQPEVGATLWEGLPWRNYNFLLLFRYLLGSPCSFDTNKIPNPCTLYVQCNVKPSLKFLLMSRFLPFIQNEPCSTGFVSFYELIVQGGLSMFHPLQPET